MSYILNCIRTTAPGVFGSEGVGDELAFPLVEVHLHRPRFMVHDLSLPAPENGLAMVAQVLHDLAEDIHKLSEVLSIGEKVPRGIG